jgi:hypothetical protein
VTCGPWAHVLVNLVSWVKGVEGGGGCASCGPKGTGSEVHSLS